MGSRGRSVVKDMGDGVVRPHGRPGFARAPSGKSPPEFWASDGIPKVCDVVFLVSRMLGGDHR